MDRSIMKVIAFCAITMMAGCGKDSNPGGPGPTPASNKLADTLGSAALTASGDSIVLQITLFTGSGLPDTLLTAYTAANILTAGPNNKYHLVSMARNAGGGWSVSSTVTKPTPVGIQFTAISNPVLDFKDALKIITDNKIVLVTDYLDLYTPLVSPALTAPVYQSMCAGASGINVVSINSASGAVTIE
jgi:hypothetical protein